MVAAKLDVQQYFLTGTRQQLTDAIMKVSTDDVECDLIPRVCSTLLTNQFVSFNGVFFKVVLGAGMGLNYAGELADLVFTILCEPAQIPNAPRLFRSSSLLFYTRFKDDILAIFDDSVPHWKQWLIQLRKNALPYVVLVETISRKAVPFLDILVTLHNRDGSASIQTDPYTKPSASKIVLPTDSGHPVSVHLSWPRTDVKRIQRTVDPFRGKLQRRKGTKTPQNIPPNVPYENCSHFWDHF